MNTNMQAIHRRKREDSQQEVKDTENRAERYQRASGGRRTRIRRTTESK